MILLTLQQYVAAVIGCLADCSRTCCIAMKHLCCAKIKPIMNLCTSVFVYVGLIGLYKRIVNADTQSIRIANADGQGTMGITPVYDTTLTIEELNKMRGK